MILCVFVLLFAVAVGTLYATNKHQRLFKKPIDKKYRAIGYALFLATFSLSIYLFNATATVFVWLMLAMLSLMLLPFIVFLVWSKP